MTLSIFDHKKNKESSQANNGQSKLGNTIYEIAKEFSPILSTNAKPKSQEEIAKEFLPTNGQASRMSNAFASGKSQSKSQEEIAKEFAPSKGQTFKHDNGANLDNQKPKYWSFYFKNMKACEILLIVNFTGYFIQMRVLS